MHISWSKQGICTVSTPPNGYLSVAGLHGHSEEPVSYRAGRTKQIWGPIAHAVGHRKAHPSHRVGHLKKDIHCIQFASSLIFPIW